LQLHRLAGGSATGLSANGAWVILVSLDGAAADDSSSMRLILKTSETFVRHWQNRPLQIQNGPLASERDQYPAGGSFGNAPGRKESAACQENSDDRVNPRSTTMRTRHSPSVLVGHVLMLRRFSAAVAPAEQAIISKPATIARIMAGGPPFYCPVLGKDRRRGK
jgi:hypothetical protein